MIHSNVIPFHCDLDEVPMINKLRSARSLLESTMAIDVMARADPIFITVLGMIKDAIKDFEMISRPQYEAEKAKRLEDMRGELEAIELRCEHLLAAIDSLEEETFEEFIGDRKYDEWKAKRSEV